MKKETIRKYVDLDSKMHGAWSFYWSYHNTKIEEIKRKVIFEWFHGNQHTSSDMYFVLDRKNLPMKKRIF